MEYVAKKNYEVRVNGYLRRRHVDQIRLRGGSPVIEDLCDPCQSQSTSVMTDSVPREIPVPEEDGTMSDTRNHRPD